jgi:hypothetical protein
MLYGESGDPDSAERLHIEDIEARSRRYLWEIAPHTHRGLYQCLLVAAGPATAHVDDSHTQLAGPALVILPPGCVHAFKFSAATEGHVLTIAPEVLFEGADEATRLSFEAVFTIPHVLRFAFHDAFVSRLQLLFARLLDEYCAPEGHSSPVCTWLALSILWLTGQELQRRHELDGGGHRAHQCLTRFQALLELHYLDHWPVARYEASHRSVTEPVPTGSPQVLAIERPSVFRIGAEAAIELDRRLIPVQYRPFEPSAIELTGELLECRQQRVPDRAAAIGRAYEEILQVQTRPAQKGRVVEKVQRKPGWHPVPFRYQCVREARLSEQMSAQICHAANHLGPEVLVISQFSDQLEDDGYIIRSHRTQIQHCCSP